MHIMHVVCIVLIVHFVYKKIEKIEVIEHFEYLLWYNTIGIFVTIFLQTVYILAMRVWSFYGYLRMGRLQCMYEICINSFYMCYCLLIMYGGKNLQETLILSTRKFHETLFDKPLWILMSRHKELCFQMS
jgi:hypothetical protein